MSWKGESLIERPRKLRVNHRIETPRNSLRILTKERPNVKALLVSGRKERNKETIPRLQEKSELF